MQALSTRGARTQEKIEQATLALFAEKGVDRTTIGDIARAAGIAEGTIYRHYPSKEELIWQLFSCHYLRLAAQLDALQAPRQGLRSKLAAMVGLFCRLYEQDPDMFRFLLLVQHGQLERVTAEMQTPVKVLKGVIEAAIARGEAPPQDTEVATAMVLGMVLQVAVFRVYGRITRSLAALAEQLAESCWRALGGATEV
ncbi:MAG: TetR family transcriptional regulator [Kiloniellaceae bacterium]|nr:TetR family transcriptional regulator [Kiloniellaceae bacterium]